MGVTVTDKSEMTKPKSGVSRRTVVKGTAWAVPAVVVASAAPAMAAGASQCITPSFSGLSCKQPGGGQNNFGYRLQICFTNTCTTTAAIVITGVQGNTGNSVRLNLNIPLQVPAGGDEVCTDPLSPIVYCSTNSANFLRVFFRVNGGPEQSQVLPSPPRDCVSPTILCPT
jgi:hypothetical protein